MQYLHRESFSFSSFTIDAVHAALCKLDPKKSAGLDNLEPYFNSFYRSSPRGPSCHGMSVHSCFCIVLPRSSCVEVCGGVTRQGSEQSAHLNLIPASIAPALNHHGQIVCLPCQTLQPVLPHIYSILFCAPPPCPCVLFLFSFPTFVEFFLCLCYYMLFSNARGGKIPPCRVSLHRERPWKQSPVDHSL